MTGKNLKQATILFIFLLVSISGTAQQDTLKIGVKPAPPFVVTKDGDVSGLSVEFWRMINTDLNKPYAFVQFEDVASLLTAVESNEVDFSINPITVSEKRMETLLFSQPFYISETSFAKRNESRFLTFIMSLFSWEFFSAVAILLFVIFIFGLLVWLFERKSGNDQFKKAPGGIADGFWWSAVTMTTVGYGDKAPTTAGGRVVGFIWMFTSIILISGLTAGIASALTVQSINSQVKSLSDLSGLKTITVANTSTNSFLDHYQIPHETTTNLEDALQKVANNNADVVVYDKPILKHQIREMNLEKELIVADEGFKTDYYSFAFPKASELYDQINPIIINKLKTREWEQMKSGLE